MDHAPQQAAPAAQRITGRLSIAGVRFEVIDFPPDMFPAGAVLLSQLPGGLEIIDRLVIPRGAIVAILDPSQAEQLRGQVRRAQAQVSEQLRKRDGNPG
jgi:hypothetical protein